MSDTSGRPILRIKPIGQLGNQMFQYMVAHSIVQRAPKVDIVGFDMPEWGLAAPTPEDYPADALILSGRYLSVPQIARYLKCGLLKHLTLSGLGMRLSNLQSVDYNRRLFAAAHDVNVRAYGPDYIVVNVRGAEILGDTHVDYGPTPLSLIEQAISSADAQPVFLGQLADDPYSSAMRDRFPGAIWEPSRGPLSDFESLRSSAQIVVAVSTFSWLAAWLSRAERIHMPMAGFFNPVQRPDLDFLPSEDGRFVFYECEPRPWRATESDFDYLLATRSHRVLDPSAVRSLRAAARRATRTQDLRKRIRFAARAYASRVGMGRGAA